ncbi:MarR family winged helix-turn-helix transcriptional regulator [Nocardia salmonicida]|uniref:MarR family winged helix-turn-helix transcriptional regulator n=1 Tax=Nocardia salmonicida TaxID=53431 RepID=UPI002E29D53F|nr:MarR family winged helix-turn-helix transcriptional regulator [Nocardia salmonicida]
MSMVEPSSLLKLLVQAADAYERALNPALRAGLGTDLRPAHYAVFRYLAPSGSRVTALAEAAGMTQQSMGELVTHLEKCGYVERAPDPADGRARLVVTTAAGREAVALAGQHIQRIEQVIAAELGAESLTVVRDALARLPAVLANQSDTRSASGGK